MDLFARMKERNTVKYILPEAIKYKIILRVESFCLEIYFCSLIIIGLISCDINLVK